jgi:hypothetical protein
LEYGKETRKVTEKENPYLIQSMRMLVSARIEMVSLTGKVEKH